MNSYNPILIRDTKITPDELKACIDYVVFTQYKSIKDFQPQIKKTLVLAYVIDKTSFPGGTISLKIELSSGEISFFPIAVFKNSADSIQSIDAFSVQYNYNITTEISASKKLVEKKLIAL